MKKLSERGYSVEGGYELCGHRGKIRHTSRKSAKKQMHQLAGIGAKGLNVYLCKHCQGWHVGHPASWNHIDAVPDDC